MAYLSALDFWGIENPENPYSELMQAMLQQSGQQDDQSQSEMSGANMGQDSLSQSGAYTGSQFSPGNLPSSGGLPEWLTNPNLPPGMTMGSESGLTIADNADWIGRGVGAVTGLPLMNVLAQALANRYYDSNVFMSPVDNPSDIDNAIDEMLYGAVPQASRMTGDTASPSGGSFSANRMVPGSGSRMNPSSGFIWGMGGLGMGQKMEKQPHTIRDKPGG